MTKFPFQRTFFFHFILLCAALIAGFFLLAYLHESIALPQERTDAFVLAQRQAEVLEEAARKDPIFTAGQITLPDHEGSAARLALIDSTGLIRAGLPAIVEMEPVIVQVHMPDGVWLLAAAPADGWEKAVAEHHDEFITTVLPIIFLAGGLISAALFYFHRLNHTITHSRREHQRSEQARLDSNNRYRSLIENAHDIVFRLALTPEEHFEYISPSVEAVLGYSPEEIYADISIWRHAIHPVERDHFATRWETIIREEAGNLSTRWMHRDGHVVLLEQTTAPIFDADGSLIAIEGISRDVTERQAASEAIRASEERYRTLVEMTPSAIFVDQDGHFAFINPAGMRLLGAESPQQILGKPIFDFIHPKDQELVKSRMAVTNSGKGVPLVDETFVRLDGSPVMVEVAAEPLTYEGKPAAIVYAQNIHQQRLAEKSLRESEARLAAVVERSPVGIAISMNGTTLYANEKYAQMFGYDRPEEVTGLPIIDFLPSGHWQAARSIASAWQQGDNSSSYIELVGLRKDGSSFDMAVQGGTLPIDGVNAVLGFFWDISERKRNERALERYHLLAENSSDIIMFIRYSDGLIVDANRAALKAYDYSAEEFQSLTINDIRAPQTRSMVRLDFQKARDGIVFETVHLRKSGETFPVEVSSRGFEINGEMLLMSIIRDITDRRRSETEMRNEMREKALKANEMEIINHVSSVMRKAATRAEMIPLLMDQMTHATGARDGAMLLYEGNILVFGAVHGCFEGLRGRRLANKEDALWIVLRDNQPVVIERGEFNGTILSSYLPQRSAGHTIIIMPVKSSLTTIGLVVLTFPEQDTIKNYQKRILQSITEMAGNALHRMTATEALTRLVEDRTRELDSIYQVSSVTNTTIDLRNAFQQALDQAMLTISASVGMIYLLNENQQQVELTAHQGVPAEVLARTGRLPVRDSIPGWVIENRDTIILPDLTEDPRSRWPHVEQDVLSFVGLPMRVQNRVVGMLGAAKDGSERFTLEEMMLLSFLADQLGLVFDHLRLYQQAERSAVLEERSRMARELHDSITQSLYSASLFASGGLKFADQGNLEQTRQYLVRLGEITQQALREMRLMVYELRLTDLRAGGLVGAIQLRLVSVERRSGINTSFQCPDELELPENLEQDLYRITLEALNNALKYSGASAVAVRLSSTGAHLNLQVEDNGAGFELDAAEAGGGVGLKSIRERAERWRGKVIFHTGDGSGTIVDVCIPVRG